MSLLTPFSVSFVDKICGPCMDGTGFIWWQDVVSTDHMKNLLFLILQNEENGKPLSYPTSLVTVTMNWKSDYRKARWGVLAAVIPIRSFSFFLLQYFPVAYGVLCMHIRNRETHTPR